MKSVLVTGCSSGFGLSIVRRFIEAGGWQVFATTRNPERLRDLQCSGFHVLAFDVSSHDGRDAISDYIGKHCSASGLNCLVNNAGYGLAGPLEVLTEAQIREQFEVNFFSPLLLTKSMLPSLRVAQGRVINISSLLGLVGMPMQSLYAASKFALEGLSESLNYELSSQSIQVCLVEPGGFRTDFAKNIRYPLESDTAQSAYKDQMIGYRNFLRRISQERPGKDPAVVADTVFKLANCVSMPVRARVGSDTQAVYYLRRSLPDRIADRIFRKIGNRILQTR